MTRLPRLFIRMLRYRVAVMIWMFMLLGAARGDGLASATLDHLWATIALGCSYVAATALNDVADEAIDKVNHPRDNGRPLVTGDASRRELLLLHWIAAGLTLGFAALDSVAALGLMTLSLVVSFCYSMPPVRLSYRTYLAPLALSVAYVLIPFALGRDAAGGALGGRDATLLAALYLLFLARINLKDFRDREGDRRYGKPTLLLRYGKRATCMVSATALAVGGALLLASWDAPIPTLAIGAGFLVAIGWMLIRLLDADDTHHEQIAIGLGARMGNGLLIAVLAGHIMQARGASPVEITLLTAALGTAFAVGFLRLAAHPELAVIGYKG